MTVAPISFIPANLVETQSTGISAEIKKPAADFASMLGHAITHANAQVAESSHELQALAVGDANNLHQVMISVEKAKLSMELVLQIRNRLLDAYQEIMREQI